MKKWNFFWVLMCVSLMPFLQSCDDDDDCYYASNVSWDWSTVCATGGGGYYLEGDRWGIIDPVTSAIPAYRPVDGKRVIAFFNPLEKVKDGVRVNMQAVQEVLTKEVEMLTVENEKDFGNDPILIYQGDMWLGGTFLNLVFLQNVPLSEKHRISLVQNNIETDDPEKVEMDEDGYVHLELRYNTYGDVTNQLAWGCVSYDLSPYFPSDKSASDEEKVKFKGFKVRLHSKENGEGVVVVLSVDHPVGVPEKVGELQERSSYIC